MMPDTVDIVYVNKGPCPKHIWDWLNARLELNDDRQVIVLIKGSQLHLELMERLEV